MVDYFTSDPHFTHRNVISHCNRPWLVGAELGVAYRDVDAMNEELVERWNAVVKNDSDRVFILGDIAMNGKKAVEFLRRCRGRKCLVRGNHDHDIVKKAPELFEWIKDYYVLTVDAAPWCEVCENKQKFGEYVAENGELVRYSNPCEKCGRAGPETPFLYGDIHWNGTAIKKTPHKVVLFHFPIEVWDGKHRGWLHFHGHSHGNLRRTIRGRVDVGMDCWDWRPVTFEEARERALSYAPEVGDHHDYEDPR
jgi:calcineurin-like phosphoesterase family protein